MRQQIDIEGKDEDGEDLCYDLDRARREGLYEEVKLLWGDEEQPLGEVDIDPSDTIMEIAHKLELSVNVGPATSQTVYFSLTYQYDYGTINPGTGELSEQT